MVRTLLLVTAGVFALASCRESVPAESTSTSGVQENRLQVVPLSVQTQRGVVRFRAEVAETEEQQAQGLMFREEIGPDEAMIFPFSPPRPASFWMKNTLIPLDMLFVRPDGSIARIAVNTVPHSLEPIGVEEPLSAVVEIAGGRSVELGISEGDRVSWAGSPTS